MKRRLAAILVADVVGYTRLMGADEADTHSAFKAHLEEFIAPTIAEHAGRIVKLTGDGALVEFGSAVDAVACGAELQCGMAQRNADVPENRRMIFRIGINLGDVIIEDEDLYGDGVNVAARLERLAEPGSVYISGTVFDQVEGKIGLDFEDLGAHEVKNVPKPVRVYRVRLDDTSSATRLSALEALPLPDKPSIAVLPFTNMSGDPEQEYFSDGMAEDIITALSRSPWLFVIARNSSFTYRGKTLNVTQVARELGVRYILEGSVRKAESRLRVTAQLVDGTDGKHIWAEKYDGTLEDVFDLQDEITRKVVSSLHTQIRLSDGARIRAGKRLELRTWDLLRRAWKLFYELRADSLAEARELMEKAIKNDPDFSEAYCVLAGLIIHEVHLGYRQDSDACLRKRALALARRSVMLDDTNEYAHWILGLIHAYNGDHASAVVEQERAIELNPNCSLAYGSLGTVLAYAGQSRESVSSNEIAIRSNPRDPSIFLRHTGLAIAFFVAEQYEQAAEWATRVVTCRPDYDVGHALLAASYAHLEREHDAEAALLKYLDNFPDAKISDLSRLPFKYKAHSKRLADGLRQLGLPE